MATDDRTSPAETGSATATGAIAAAVIGGAVVGVFLETTGHMARIADLYGFHHPLSGWTVHFFHTVVAGTFFAMTIAIVATGLRRIYVLERPISMVVISVLVGVLYGLVVWVVAVALLLPIWMEVVMALDRPIPYVHVPSLLGLSLFGIVVGICFPVFYWLARVLNL